VESGSCSLRLEEEGGPCVSVGSIPRVYRRDPLEEVGGKVLGDSVVPEGGE